MKEVIVKSIDHLIELISAIEWKHKWYRGVRSRKYNLEPSVYRYNEEGFRHYGTNEKRICERFHERSSQLIPRSNGDEINILILLQHYGLPTRLLDWTASLPIALSFALEGFSDTPTIWMINPIGVNAHNSRYNSNDLPNSWSSPIVNKYAKLAFNGWHDNAAKPVHLNDVGDMPLAFKPFYADPRLLIQQSRFTIHGYDDRPLDTQIFQFKPSGGNLLRKYILDFNRDSRKALDLLKLDNSTLYPDREGLVRRLQHDLTHDLKMQLSLRIKI